MIVQLYDNAPIHYCAQPMDFKYMYDEKDKVYTMVVSSVGVSQCDREKLKPVFEAIDAQTKDGSFIDLIIFKQGTQKLRMSMALVTKQYSGDDCMYEIESNKDDVTISGVFKDDCNWCSNIVESKKIKSKRKITGKITRR